MPGFTISRGVASSVGSPTGLWKPRPAALTGGPGSPPPAARRKASCCPAPRPQAIASCELASAQHAWLVRGLRNTKALADAKLGGPLACPSQPASMGLASLVSGPGMLALLVGWQGAEAGGRSVGEDSCHVPCPARPAALAAGEAGAELCLPTEGIQSLSAQSCRKATGASPQEHAQRGARWPPAHSRVRAQQGPGGVAKPAELGERRRRGRPRSRCSQPGSSLGT